MQLSEEDLFLVLVCDGITDVLSDAAIVECAARLWGHPPSAGTKAIWYFT